MMDLSHYILSLPLLLLVILRMLGVFMVAPVFSHVVVPLQVRAFLAVAVGLAVVGQTGHAAFWPGSAAALLAAGALELGIGAAVGYAARLVFAGIEMGAVYIGQQMGVGLIEALNPMADDESGTVRQLFGMLTIVIFLGIGGHRELIGGVMGTFQAAPVFGQAEGWQLLTMIAGLLKASFVLALNVASPVLISLILATVAMGLLQRSIPQLNLFSIGFPVYAMLGLLVLAATVATLTYLLRSAWMLTNGQVTAWLKTVS